MPRCICDSTPSTPTGGGAGRGGGRTIPLSCGFSGLAALSQVYSEVLLPWPPWPPGPPSSSDLGGLWLLFILSPVEFSWWAHSSTWAPGLQEAEGPGSVGVCVCLCVCLCPCEQCSPFRVCFVLGLWPVSPRERSPGLRAPGAHSRGPRVQLGAPGPAGAGAAAPILLPECRHQLLKTGAPA